LIGRVGELAAVRGFFEDATVRGGALVVVGDPGVGKTSLLDEFAAGEAERGALVLRAAGVQYESGVGYSALNQLLFPLGEEMPGLSPPHRSALRTALGFDVGPVPDRLVVSNAALLWLRCTAAERPIFVIIDDIQWVDRASAEVLGFVARRLVGSPIGFLAACRSTERGSFRHNGLTELSLAPLDGAAARALLDTRFPELAPAVRQRLLAEAAGNPLALLELPSALDGEQRADFTTLPEVLPLPERLQAVFASRVRGLPDRCRLMMLLGALGGTIELALLRRAGADACNLDDLAPAEDASLVQVGANRLTFRHPLIRAAVVEASSGRDRRWAHAALAEAIDVPERRVRHLAESAISPDEDIASQLEAAAQAVSRRGDALGAVAALTRAAELSPDPAQRSRRLAEAAYLGADAGGELVTASRLLTDARRSGYLDTNSLPAAAATAHLLINSDGDVTTAHRLLAAAIEAGDHGFDASDTILVEALFTLHLISWYIGTDEAWGTFHAIVGRLRPAPPPVLRANVAVFSDPARATPEDFAALDEIIDAVDLTEEPTRLIRIGTAAVFGDRLDRLRGAELHLVQTHGPARRQLGALMHLGIDGFHAGRWAEARQYCDAGLAVCTEHHLTFFRWYFHWVHAMIAGAAGEVAVVRRLTDDIGSWAVAHQAAGIAAFAWQARATGEIGAGDYEAAYQYAAKVSPPGVLQRFRQSALWSGLDLVEAAMLTGRRTEAVRHARALEELVKVSPRMRLLSQAATALTAGDENARERFEKALSEPELERWPFDLGRVQLAYGQRLRRLRDTGAARAQLTQAHDTLGAIGALPWRDRAASELRATGLTRQSGGEPNAPLTPQEREIAELAGAGLTNKQIGQKLFISHRTVGDHLYKIFPKLGITSRAALRDALTAYDHRVQSGAAVR
jgi:DNA-binding CsgD family transcriptional regulator